MNKQTRHYNTGDMVRVHDIGDIGLVLQPAYLLNKDQSKDFFGYTIQTLTGELYNWPVSLLELISKAE